MQSLRASLSNTCLDLRVLLVLEHAVNALSDRCADVLMRKAQLLVCDMAPVCSRQQQQQHIRALLHRSCGDRRELSTNRTRRAPHVIQARASMQVRLGAFKMPLYTCSALPAGPSIAGRQRLPPFVF